MSIVECVLLKNDRGFSVQILTLGGIITKIMAKDNFGIRENVVLSYDDFDDYFLNPLFLGCFIGPVAGRTKDGQLMIDDKLHQLDVSDHPNALHSCKKGLHNVIWTIKSHTSDQLVLTFITHPKTELEGILTYQLTYSISNEALTIDYLVTSTKKTYLSLTNHSYFNLSGSSLQTVLSHDLELHCTHMARLNHESLPEEILSFEDLNLDFTTSRSIGSIIASSPEIFLNTSGLDHPFKCAPFDYVARLKDFNTGRVLTVSTTQPYLILYSGNFLHTACSASGKQFNQYTGICFETQDLPNVVNNKLDAVQFVTPESPYMHSTTFAFSIIHA